MNEERLARIALTLAIEPGHKTLAKLVMDVGAVEAWQLILAGKFGRAWQNSAQKVDSTDVKRLAKLQHFHFLIPSDEHWPNPLNGLATVQLDSVAGAPLGIWVRGNLEPLFANPGLAIVGARSATNYGIDVATELAADLAERKISIVSGGAFGIDAAAHRGALAVGGHTIAVLACGVDIAYPATNAELLARIASTGALISELPPGYHPMRHRFLSRNRIVAALGQATIIVEAAARSGAKNTVNWTQQLGKDVLAVPGSIHSANSITPHRMIRDHEAILISSAAEAITLVQPLGHSKLLDAEGEQRLFDTLSKPARKIYEVLPAHDCLSIGEIAVLAQLTWVDTARHLADLESCGLVRATGEDLFERGMTNPATQLRQTQPIRTV